MGTRSQWEGRLPPSTVLPPMDGLVTGHQEGSERIVAGLRICP